MLAVKEKNNQVKLLQALMGLFAETDLLIDMCNAKTKQEIIQLLEQSKDE